VQHMVDGSAMHGCINTLGPVYTMEEKSTGHGERAFLNCDWSKMFWQGSMFPILKYYFTSKLYEHSDMWEHQTHQCG
jgi:hypothetical protein